MQKQFDGLKDSVASSLSGVEDKVSDHADKMGELGEKVGNNFASAMTLALAAGAADFLNTLRSTIDTASEYASRLASLSSITGDSPQKLQKFEFALRSVGVSSDQSQRQLSQLQIRIEAAAARANDTSSIFARLGLNAKNMVDKSAIENFETISNKIAELGTHTERVSAASLAFGALVGPKLVPLLEQGKSGIDALMGSADAYGALIGDKLRSDLEQYAIAQDQAKQSTQAFFATLAGPIIPALTKFSDELKKFMAAVEHSGPATQLAIVILSLAASFTVLEKGLATVGSFFRSFVSEELLGALKDLGAGLGEFIIVIGLFVAAWQTNFAGIRPILMGIWDAVVTFVQNLINAFGRIKDFIVAQLGPAFNDLGHALSPLLVLIGDLISAILRSNILIAIWEFAMKAVVIVLKIALEVLSVAVSLISSLAEGFVALGAVTADALSQVVSWLAEADTATANFLDTLSKIPIIGGLLHNLASFLRDDAKHTAELAKNLKGAGAALGAEVDRMNGAGQPDMANASSGSWGPPDKKKPGGSGTLGSGQKAKDGTSEWLTELKAGSDKYKEALRETQVELAKTADRIKEMTAAGINSISQVKAVQAQYNEEIVQTQVEIKREQALRAEYQRELAVVTNKANHTSNQADKNKLVKEEWSLKTLIDGVDKNTAADEAKIADDRKKNLQVEIDFQKLLAADDTNSFNARIAALQRELQLLIQQHATHAAILAIQKQITALQGEQVDHAQSTGRAADSQRTAQLSSGIASRDSVEFHGPRADQEEQARKVADAFDQLEVKLIESKEAEQQLDDAAQAYTRSVGEGEAAEKAAWDKLISAQATATTATQNLTAAQNTLVHTQMATDPVVTKVTQGLDKLASQALGPLYNVIVQIQQGMNPLVAIFLELFDKTTAFKMVMDAFQAIVKVIVQILDDLQPVITLLLGVLIGVVNVFIFFYNIVVDILGLFGITVQRLTALNDSIFDTDGQMQTLTNIVHDLPTINEYNAGKWGDLKAEANPNASDPMLNNTDIVSGLGQIVGQLIGIYAILRIIAGTGALGNFLGGSSSGGGILGTISNWLGIGKKGGSASTGSNVTPGSGGLYTVGDADATGGTAASSTGGLFSAGDADGVGGLVDAQGGASPVTVAAFSGTAQAQQATATTTGVTNATTNTGMTAATIGAKVAEGVAIGGAAASVTGGNTSNGALGGLLGSVLGIALHANPLIGAGIDLVTGIVGGMFGPHYSPSTNPDMYASTDGYATAMQNYQNDTEFGGSEDPTIKQQLGGDTEQQYISSYIANNPQEAAQLLTPDEISEMTGGGVSNLHQGNLTVGSNNDVVPWATFFNNVNDALNKIVNNTNAYSGLTSNLQGLTDISAVSLAALYGNGSSVTAATGGSDSTGAAFGDVTINIGNVNGDPATVGPAMTKIISDALTTQATALAQQRRTNTFTYAEYTS